MFAFEGSFRLNVTIWKSILSFENYSN